MSQGASPTRPSESLAVRIGRALAHPLRARVLVFMVEGERHRAGALARRFHVALPLMKQHLQRLLAAGLLTTDRVDGAVYYRVAESPALGPVRALLAFAA